MSRTLGRVISGEPWRLGHRPALDGLRAGAVLLVIGYHLHGAVLPAGGIVGVTTFFVLSGFLITSLLLEEHDDTGQVDLRAFYSRRARRLVPALVVMLLVVGPFAVAVGNIGPDDLLAVLAYSANWWAASGHSLGMLNHTWTLATEEQFYVLWPVLLLLVRRTRHAVALTLATAVLLVASGLLGGASSSAAILAGCALALGLHGRHGVRPASAWLAPALLVALVGASRLDVPATSAIALTTALATALVYTIASGARVPLLTSSVARAVGARSYGLYLWHLPVLAITALVGHTSGRLVALPVLVLVVELSWRYVEKPFRPGSGGGRVGGHAGTGERGPVERDLIDESAGDGPGTV